MFGLTDDGPKDAIDLLKQDHRDVEQLFDEFASAKDDGAADNVKADIVAQICKALTIHAQIEEEIFYPAMRRVEGTADLMDEATVEHQSLKDLIAQLEGDPPESDLYDAKVQVLSEYVKHHVKEEEGEIFPAAKKSELDLDSLGKQLTERKDELNGASMPLPEDERKNARKSTKRAKPASRARH
jgi:hemerythrin superfamily protein